MLLIVCDGWGIGPTEPAAAAARGNAVAMARTPVHDALVRSRPWGLLRTSGEAVGLPPGQMGNSEVGHLNLGAGRIVDQDVTRISGAIADGSFFRLPALGDLGAGLRESRGALHLVGLCSDGGVHSEISHLWALLEWVERQDLPFWVHAITDGRDSSPRAGSGWMRELEARTSRIATLAGRYWAMDRDRRWERTERAWRTIALGEGERVSSASACLEESYAAGITDEFAEPVVVEPNRTKTEERSNNAPYAGIGPNDALLFFNFRADRARQLVSALADPDFPHFARPRDPCPRLVSMTRYADDFLHPVLFPPRALADVLGEAISSAGRTQLRMAETEKYPHVTYFFNGGVEEPFPGEDRHLIPSPGVATYDLQPEMSAPALTDALLEHLARDDHDFILVNYANADMVGHTGSIPATIRAVEAVDACVGRVLRAAERAGATALVTADHGNAEEMLSEDGSPFTAHTTGPVRLILVEPEGRAVAAQGVRNGILADVAPTVLRLMDLPQPAAMTGRSLLA